MTLRDFAYPAWAATIIAGKRSSWLRLEK